MLEEDLTKQIIGAAQEVHKVLGFGFLEAVYGNALFKELKSRGLKCECQKHLDVFYKGECVGHYVPDMIVEDKVIIELKAVKICILSMNGNYQTISLPVRLRWDCSSISAYHYK